MLSYLLSQLGQVLVVFVRVIRAFISRRLSGIVSRFRQLTNLTRGATKVATDSLQSAAAATQKPTKREDYIEAGSLLVAKSFLIKLVIILVVVFLLIYFLIWPFILGHFLTAKFYVEDNRIDNWSGRVIVYSDKKKTIPLYEGKLEDGLLEGQGKEYDGNGVLTYEGNFESGQRSGQGTSYKNGVPTYKGNFEEGVASGEGISYNSKGEMVYQGEFADGEPNGTGKAYADGRMIYQGGFEAGKYSGEGTLYPVEGEQISATFQEGEPDGEVTWSRNGHKYYQGEWEDKRPEGYGTLYSQSGKTLYQGEMSGGTLDGQWLISLTLDDLKEALGDASTTTTQENNQSFLLIDSELGLVARCSYQSEDTESEVYSIYLFQPKNDNWVRLLPGMDHITVEIDGEITDRKTGNLQFNTPKGVEVSPGVYYSEMIFTADTRTTILREDASSPIVLLTWSRREAIPTSSIMGGGDSSGGSGSGSDSSGGGSGGDSSSQTVDEFVESLDKMENADGVGSVATDYCGDKSVSDALKACSTPDKLSSLVDAMTDYWLQSETQAGLEDNLTRIQSQIDDANASSSMGSSSSTSSLEKEKSSLESQITSCKNKRAQAQVTAKEVAGIDPADYAAGDILVTFDPTSLNVSSLVSIAAAYAQSTGEEVDSDSLELEIKNLLLEMNDSYSQIESAVEACQQAADETKSTAVSFVMGESNKSSWYSAMNSEVDAELALYDAVASFTKLANELNTLTGGWVSRNCDWYEKEMSSIFKDAMTEDTEKTESSAGTDSSTKTETSDEGGS